MTVERLANESAAYRVARRALWEAEVALKEQREQVAALRRALPVDTVAVDYELQYVHTGESSSARAIRLRDLFADADAPLVVMHFMYGKQQSTVCPMCAMWADGYDKLMKHLNQRVNFALAVAGDAEAFREVARERNWAHLPVVSTAGCTMKLDLKMEDEQGAQLPGVSVFVLRDGELFHTYSASAIMGGGHYRGLDLLSPVWNFLDLTPEGRGDWMPGLA